MPRIAFILFLATCIVCPGCQTMANRQVHTVWKKYLMVKEGMTASEVYAIEPPSVMTIGTGDGNQMSCWQYGRPFANQDYVVMDVVFGKDNQVKSVDRELRHGHVIHDLPTWP